MKKVDDFKSIADDLAVKENTEKTLQLKNIMEAGLFSLPGLAFLVIGMLLFSIILFDRKEKNVEGRLPSSSFVTDGTSYYWTIEELEAFDFNQGRTQEDFVGEYGLANEMKSDGTETTLIYKREDRGADGFLSVFFDFKWSEKDNGEVLESIFYTGYPLPEVVGAESREFDWTKEEVERLPVGNTFTDKKGMSYTDVVKQHGLAKRGYANGSISENYTSREISIEYNSDEKERKSDRHSVSMHFTQEEDGEYYLTSANWYD